MNTESSTAEDLYYVESNVSPDSGQVGTIRATQEQFEEIVNIIALNPDYSSEIKMMITKARSSEELIGSIRSFLRLGNNPVEPKDDIDKQFLPFILPTVRAQVASMIQIEQ